ncbi:sensor domain-containing protein [Micromonospora sp. NPDC005173]|uniref:sensor histidine kinase n=1 Tax=Micromonospora sp. NPDC005173 TaxID=3157165 RepID=UPI0033B96B52
MRTDSPPTALRALGYRRFLASRWPWRSAAYLLTTLPAAVPAFAVLAIPWLVLVTRLATEGFAAGTILFLIFIGTALVGILGPVIAPPLANLERRRLRLVDDRPTAAPRRRPPLPGPLSWLRHRYTDPATWREVGYACLLATVAPVLSIAALLTLPWAVVSIVSPLIVLAQQPGGDPVALGFGTAATVEQTVPYTVMGVLVLPLIPYLQALVAGGHAAAARALLLTDSAERLRAELVEVSRSRVRLADAFEAERRRIQRDLHDGAQQTLVSLTLQLGLIKVDLPPDSTAASGIAKAHDRAKQLMAQLRQLIDGIQPQVLSDLGLPAALEELADRSTIPVTVDVDMSGRLSDQTENAAYFVAAEALTNIAKHSGATSAAVTVRQQRDSLTVEISDNGRGGADPDRGTGLTGLADRVAVNGGRMLLSSPAGGPTVLRVELPCSQQPSG